MNEPEFVDEVKLMGYGESDSSGCWVKWQVHESQLPIFRGLKGEIFECVLRRKHET